MAQKTIAHLIVQPQLFNDMVQILEQIPGSATRGVLNRIENVTGTNECQAAFKSNSLAEKTGKKRPTKKRKRVAPKKGAK